MERKMVRPFEKLLATQMIGLSSNDLLLLLFRSSNFHFTLFKIIKRKKGKGTEDNGATQMADF